MLFITLVNAIAENLNNKEFVQFITPYEYEFIDSLVKNNIGLLNTIFESIQSLESKDGTIYLHDIPSIIHTIIILFRVHLVKNGKCEVSLLGVVKFIIETLVSNEILKFGDNVLYDDVKSQIRTAIQLFQTDAKIKMPKPMLQYIKNMFSYYKKK